MIILCTIDFLKDFRKEDYILFNDEFFETTFFNDVFIERVQFIYDKGYFERPRRISKMEIAEYYLKSKSLVNKWINEIQSVAYRFIYDEVLNFDKPYPVPTERQKEILKYALNNGYWDYRKA